MALKLNNEKTDENWQRWNLASRDESWRDEISLITGSDTTEY